MPPRNGERRVMTSSHIAVIGAGPAGLGAALELVRNGHAPIILDRNTQVGGLARTIWYKGYGFDLGPHRFFTKNREVEHLWGEILGEEFRPVPRLTRIYYNGRFFHYPLKPMNALLGLGPITSARAVLSYVRERLRARGREPANFEEWVVGQFGKVLYEAFFKGYTEKVWGIPCHQVSKEWAGQRIRGLNLAEAIRGALGLGRRGAVRSLVEQFHYPRRGAGQMWETLARKIVDLGAELRLDTTVLGLHADGDRITEIVCSSNGDTWTMPVEFVFSSAPITAMTQALTPAPPSDVLQAARALYYRAHLTVNLVITGTDLFPDNWVYVHSPSVRMARVANYRNFSPAMSDGTGGTGVSVEYFCFSGDDLWVLPDDELIALAKRELAMVGLLPRGEVTDGFVVREADSYPAYYLGHQDQFRVLFEFFRRFRNLRLIGRAGMYRYNNQDHAMLTGLYAARNFLGQSNVDIFKINAEEEYIEEVSATQADESSE